MENRIVIVSASKMREVARTALKNHWKEMFLGMFIYYIFSGVIPSILDLFFTATRYMELVTGEYISMDVTYASPVYDFILSGPLLLGFLMFLLAFFRKHTVEYALTLEGFSMFGKGFLLYLMYSIRIFLWSLLFIIPGFIAAFRYSQAFFLRIDHPEWTTSQCIQASCYLMKGNKAKLFGVYLSFIGWYILAMIPGSFLSMFFTNEVALLIVAMISSIPVLFVDLYMYMTETVFYELLTGNLVIQERSPFEQFNEDKF